MMNRRLLVEAFREDDAQGLCSFMGKIFAREGMRKADHFDETFWRWQYRSHPAGAAFTVVARDGDSIVGHIANIPAPLEVDGREVPAVVTIDLMVEEAYRRRGVFRLMGDASNAMLEKAGVLLSLAFPSRYESYAGFIKKLGWFVVGDLKIWGRPAFGRVQEGVAGIRVSRLSGFPDAVDQLWDRLKPDYGIALKRTARCLNWRYFGNPAGNYQVLAAHRGEELLGYLVLQVMRISGLRVGLIVDLLCLNRVEVLRPLMDQARRVFLKESAFLCLILGNRIQIPLLRRLGFREFPRVLSPKKYTLIARINQPGTSVKDWIPVDRWTLHFGDWDVV